MFLKVLSLVWLLSSWTSAQGLKDLNPVIEWMSLEYEFSSDTERQYAVDSGMYKQNAGVPIDIAVEYKPSGKMRIFQTIPRFDDGIPFTLATVISYSIKNGPAIEAYPSYAWHNVNNPNCAGITSACRVVIDECQHMWVIDSGIANDVQMCPPQLLVFDLNTDSLIRRFQFPAYLYTPSQSLFVSLAIDIRDPPPSGTCRKAMAYVADVKLGRLVVYNAERHRAWKIEHELMLPRPAWKNHTIDGQTIELNNGIFSLNVSPRSASNRLIYFHAQSDDRECSVPLTFVDNQLSSLNKNSPQFQVLGSRGVQSVMEAMDSEGNMFTSTNDPLTIFTWNINTPYRETSFKVVANNPDQLQYISGMKVVKHPMGHSELWVLSNSWHRTALNTRNFNDINFKILFCNTEDLLKNGKCTQLKALDWANLLHTEEETQEMWVF